jgi:hypothetical protein
VDDVKPRPAVEAFVLALMEATTNLEAESPGAPVPARETGEPSGFAAATD